MMRVVLEVLSDYVEFDTEEMTPELNLLSDLNMTSYDRISMLGDIEKRLGIEIPEEEIINLSTLGEIVDYLGKKPR